MQTVFAPHHLQSVLQVNDEHRGYSIRVQSWDLIIPNALQLEPPVFPGLFSSTSKGAIQSPSELSSANTLNPVALVPCEGTIISTTGQPAFNAGCLCTLSLAINPASERSASWLLHSGTIRQSDRSKRTAVGLPSLTCIVFLHLPRCCLPRQ